MAKFIQEYHIDDEGNKESVKWEFYIVNGKKEGEVKCYYNTGEIFSTINYITPFSL